MPLPLLLAAAAVPALYKGIKGIAQGIEADNLSLRDTTPPAFREALGLSRQAATAGLPGEGQIIDRLGAGTNDVLSAGVRAGTSASSILGLLSSSDENRRKGLADLGIRADAYHQKQQGYLSEMLKQQAAYQKADQQELDRNRAALTESSQRNIYGAFDGASQVATYGLSKMDADDAAGGLNSSLIRKAGKKVAAAHGPIFSGPDDILTPRGDYKFGVPTYRGLPIGNMS